MKATPINNENKVIKPFNDPKPNSRFLFLQPGYDNAIAVRKKTEAILPDVFHTLAETGQQETLLYNYTARQTVSPSDMRLCLPSQKGFIVVKQEEIIYCEAQRCYTLFHLANSRPIMVSRPLFDYERLLADTFFLRIHKTFFINLMHVKEYIRGEGGTVIMSNGMEIDVSRRKKDQFLLKVKGFFKY